MHGSLSENFAAIAQTVERVLGKDEVSGSIPDSSSSLTPRKPAWHIALRVCLWVS